ncbi:MAG TPA: hypothetical protein VFX20_18220 [Steroidobacteraceae bacterium]|nr:hypothetical protein [Steroidobacteraceae bacterium]
MSALAWRTLALELLEAAQHDLACGPFCKPHVNCDTVPAWHRRAAEIEKFETVRLEARQELSLEEFNSPPIVFVDGPAAGRPDQLRFWILAEEVLERERRARQEWLREAGMV